MNISEDLNNQEPMDENVYVPGLTASIFANMRNRLNNYWAKTAKETLENDFDRDMLFDADMNNTELRKRIKIKHLL